MTLKTVNGTQLRDTVGSFPSGVTVVTTTDGEVDHGLTVSAFVSLSLEPAMVLVSIDKKSSVVPFLEQGSPVAVSVLSEEQSDLAITFGRHLENKFNGVSINRSTNRAAVLEGASAWLSGAVVDKYPGGDHFIITIAVEECAHDEEQKPLLYHRGRLFQWQED